MGCFCNCVFSCAVVNQTDPSKSVRNRSLYNQHFVLSLCRFDISAGVGAFVIGLSQIASFFSFDCDELNYCIF